MKKLILAGAVALTGVMMFAGQAGADIQEGKWSMTMVTKTSAMPGADDAMKELEKMSPEEKAMMQQMMGGMGVSLSGNGAGMTTTVTKCLTNQNPVPSPEEGCTQTHSFQGNTMNFESVCSDSRSTGQVTYENHAMQGTIHSHQNEGGDATIEISGQYLGPCN